MVAPSGKHSPDLWSAVKVTSLQLSKANGEFHLTIEQLSKVLMAVLFGQFRIVGGVESILQGLRLMTVTVKAQSDLFPLVSLAV